MGRTGEWFGHEHDSVVPDVLTLAKGLGGGLPIGACIAVGAAATRLRPGDHGSTFGGNPLACAAALAVIDTIDADGLLAHVTAVGSRLMDGVRDLVGTVPLLTGIRGRGLWLALTFEGPVAAAVEAAARDAGFLVNAVAPDAIRLAPPLVLPVEAADALVAALPGILGAAAAKVAAQPTGPGGQP
jgi:acetylornithine aminotransferase